MDDNKQTMYFDVHVFHSRNNGFSVPVKAEVGELGKCFLGFDEDEVLDLALVKCVLDAEDAHAVDYVEEIDEEQYKQMGGK